MNDRIRVPLGAWTTHGVDYRTLIGQRTQGRLIIAVRVIPDPDPEFAGQLELTVERERSTARAVADP